MMEIFYKELKIHKPHMRLKDSNQVRDEGITNTDFRCGIAVFDSAPYY